MALSFSSLSLSCVLFLLLNYSAGTHCRTWDVLKTLPCNSVSTLFYFPIHSISLITSELFVSNGEVSVTSRIFAFDTRLFLIISCVLYSSVCFQHHLLHIFACTLHYMFAQALQFFCFLLFSQSQHDMSNSTHNSLILLSTLCLLCFQCLPRHLPAVVSASR
jgi:hypothetical protein